MTLALPPCLWVRGFNNANAREHVLIHLFEDKKSFMRSALGYIDHIGTPPEAEDFLFQHTFDLRDTVHVHPEWMLTQVYEKGV